MINPMQQVVIATRKRESEAVITALQDAGVLHLKPIEEGPLSTGSLAGQDAEDRRNTERLLARAESTIAELGTHRPAPVSLPAIDEWESVVEGAAQPVSELAKERQELQADLEAEKAFGKVVHKFNEMAGPLDQSKRIALVPFLLQAGDELTELDYSLREQFAERFEVAVEPVGDHRVGVLAVPMAERDVARSILSKVRLGELRLPGRFDQMPISKVAEIMEDLRSTGESRLQKLNAERDQLAKQHAAQLYVVRDALKDQVAIHDVRAVSARGKYSLVLQGYLPEDRVAGLKTALDRFGESVSYELHKVDEHHDGHIPVELKNNGYVKPFQLFMGLLSPPKYGSFDPTWILSIFIPFFFGMIIADVGYSLLFLAFGLWISGKVRRNEGLNLDFMGAYVPPETLKDLAFVTFMMTFWSMIWGVLTGEFFGTLFEKLGFFYFDANLVNTLWGWTGIKAVPHAPHDYLLPHVIPIVFPRLEIGLFANVALVFALLFGILQVLWGWAIRAQQGIKHKDTAHTIEGIGMFFGLVGLVLLAFATQAAKNLDQATNFANPLVIPMWICFAVFLVCYFAVVKKFPLMIMELISQGGAIVSYARIFAVGLVGAVLAKLSSEAGLSIAESMGPIGIVLGIIVGTLLHTVILVFTLIGHILQPIRLHMLEFLNPTGFNQEASPLYNPLRRLSPANNAGQVK